MTSHMVASWGNVIRSKHQMLRMRSRFDSFPQLEPGATVLPRGNGRSYGDSCLNPGGAVLDMRSLDRFIRFDRHTGVLMCEAGVLLSELLVLALPAGWFLRVVPGTQYVTIGGAIANDVHGKNHHRAGTFGHHVRRFELLRSTGERLICSRTENADWFRATVGGLGLTGIITWAELQLRPVAGPWINAESIRFANLEEFFGLSDQSNRDFEYVVAWIDCVGRGGHVGRGVLHRADHCAGKSTQAIYRRSSLNVPFTPPCSLINSWSLRIGNMAIYHRQLRRSRRLLTHYEQFFFPLDRIQNWNRLYGRHGFFQYQCIIPTATAQDAIRELLTLISRSGSGSFLAVLKQCGAAEGVGMLSFPLQGLSLALDFPNQGSRTEHLFARLDAVVRGARGRLYPAKDARMPKALFRAGYPQWEDFLKFVDPQCSSGFWQRVGSVQPNWSPRHEREDADESVDSRAAWARGGP